jgi:cold shock CspA family protein
MLLTGTLKIWNDERGFGFITPTNGGSELFVHISAFPRDGLCPIIGESLTYELGRSRDGKPSAVRVYRPFSSKASIPPRNQGPVASHRQSLLPLIIPLLLVVALGAYGYTQFKDRTHRRQLADLVSTTITEQVTQPVAGSFLCDGRTYCSQMTSCSEAKFFINNCPGTQMDGNNDGVPCEQQWCTKSISE